MDALLVRSDAIDCSAYAYNATLGPLQIDYVYLHYCTFAGVPLLSALALLLWLAGLFFFRTPSSFCSCTHRQRCSSLASWSIDLPTN